MKTRYYLKYAAAAARGNLLRRGMAGKIGERLMSESLEQLDDGDCSRILEVAASEGVKLYYFKRSDRTMPRVNKVIGYLKGNFFDSLLDVGSGRGVFLLPFLEEFPSVKVHSVDILDKRIGLLTDISVGGVSRLSVSMEDICHSEIPDNSYDVVTLLEVLEHIPDYRAAIAQAVRIARKLVVVTVPSKEDDNPEHIHLLTRDKLEAAFALPKVKRLSFDAVPCHLFLAARLAEI